MKHRGTDRNKVLMPASIEFDSIRINCLIRNMSTTGAMIDVNGEAIIPAYFVLVLLLNGPRKYCRLIWRTENRLGVEFE